MFRFLLFTSLAFILASCSEPESSQSTDSNNARVELIYNAYLPPLDLVRATVVEDFAGRIEQESSGTISISIPGASLSAASDQWGLLNDGIADIAMVPIWSRRNTIVLPSLAELPLNSLSSESASVALWRTQQNYFAALNEFDGYQVLGMYTLAPSHIVTTSKPVRNYQDLEGLKLWGPPGSAMQVIQSVGATPVSSEYLQMFEYVSKGTVDGVMVSAGAIKNAGIGGEVNYYTQIPGGLGSVSFAIIMSDEAWGRLNPEQQQAVTRAAEGLAARAGKNLDDIGDMVLSEFGLEIINADENLTARVQESLAAIRGTWVQRATEAGLANAQEAFDYYIEQMQMVEAEIRNRESE